MIALTLDELARFAGGVLHIGSTASTTDVPVSGTTVVAGAVDTDSRIIVPGGIFVAKRGETTDGHLFAAGAVDAGAAALIVERVLPLAVPQIVVADAVEALASLATAVVARVRESGTMRIVGVTGSNGKTTTKNLLRAICGLAGPTVASRDSFNNEVGGPLTMLEITHDTRYLVAEMGASRVGEIARLVAMAPPDVGVVLKVGLAHAGEFGGIERTTIAKSEMVVDLPATATAVLNRDDPRVAGMAAKTRAQVLWFGHDLGAGDGAAGTDHEVRATDLEVGATGTRFTLRMPDGAHASVFFAVLGEHHVANALAAAAAAHALGIDLDTIVAGLQSVTRAERWRMEVLTTTPITVINDAYNASPDSMAAALKALVQIAPPSSRTVAVLGEMAELGEFSEQEHETIGLLVVRLNVGQVIVVGEGAKRIHMAASFQGSWDGESLYAETIDEAESLLADVLEPGDTVLVKSSKSAELRFLGDRLADAVRAGGAA